jgi:hypothetical protein
VTVKLKVLERALEAIRGELADFDPALITTGDAALVFDAFLRLEQASVAGKTLVATRAAESGRWKEQGHKSVASAMAAAAGTGLGEVIGMLETSERLTALPETSDALKRGELSGAQVKEIASTAAANPAAEGALIEAAGRRGFKGLREECLRVKARALSETEASARHHRIWKNRSVRMWVDHEGVGRLEARLTAEDLARVGACVRAEADVVFQAARRAGRREPTVAYEADALVALLTGHGQSAPASATSGRAADTMVHLVVDAAALQRGEVDDGEVCEIPGVGPVPLATARGVLGEATVKVIIKKGVDVASVVHVGRAVPAHLRSALERRDPVCVVPGCEDTQRLEIDHYKVPFHLNGPTEMWNLCRICHWHHHLKTHCGYALVGEPGTWEWRTPVDESNQVLTA